MQLGGFEPQDNCSHTVPVATGSVWWGFEGPGLSAAVFHLGLQDNLTLGIRMWQPH